MNSAKAGQRTPRLMGGRMALGWVLGVWVVVQPVLAASEGAVDRISALVREGRWSEAERELKQAQAQSGGGEAGASLQFLSCQLQAQQGAIPKAMACYQKLIQEHPQLPDAYNNLGVLHAARGQLVEARSWFERGLRQHTAYATLHQNMLNLQTELNRNAYQSALQLGATQGPLPSVRLTMLGQVQDKAVSVPPQMAASAARPPAVAASAAAPVTAAASKPVTTPPVVAAGTPVKASEAATALPDAQAQEQVQSAVKAWAAAWSQKDIEAYFKAYSSRFVPGEGVSLAQWQEQRRLRISGKKQIRVDVGQLRVAQEGGKTVASFVQTYESSPIRAVSRKQLELVLENGHWLIVRETVGSPVSAP